MEIKELYRIFCEHPVVTTDTRDCPAGSLFFALKGSTFDGNEFARAALERGCSYAIVERVCGEVPAELRERFIIVPDTLRAMQELALLHRRSLGLPVLQITGTNGKTTTKELTAAVLGERYNVLFTQGNLNNHIGVPKTLLRLTSAHDVAVIETGANHPGEIAQLSRIVEADCGLITNVGRAHLEGFGSFEGVCRTKGELYDSLRGRRDAFVFLHGDSPYLPKMAAGLPVFTYGAPGADYDVEGEVVSCAPFLKFRWRPRGGAWMEVQTRLVGAYNVHNTLAAAAVGVRFGVDPSLVCRALENYVPANSRSEYRRTAHNELIVDAYNANPTSMMAALDNFDHITHPAKMVVLGQMCELGESSEEEHRKLVERVEAMQLEDVWLVGELFAPYAGRHQVFPDVDTLVRKLGQSPVEGRLILIKGSNSTRLYQLPPLF